MHDCMSFYKSEGGMEEREGGNDKGGGKMWESGDNGRQGDRCERTK